MLVLGCLNMIINLLLFCYFNQFSLFVSNLPQINANIKQDLHLECGGNVVSSSHTGTKTIILLKNT